MTISSTTRVAGPFVGDDAVVNLDFTFKVFDDSEVQILSRLDSTGVDTELVLGADYTVALNADQDTAPGGRVTLSGPLATGRTAFIVSEVSPLQESVFTNTGGFYPSVLNDALDRLHALHLENREVNSRAVVTPVGETGNLTLPPVDNRVGKYIYFDALGNIVAADGTDAGTAMAAVLAVLDSNTLGEGASLVGLTTGETVEAAVQSAKSRLTLLEQDALSIAEVCSRGSSGAISAANKTAFQTLMGQAVTENKAILIPSGDWYIDGGISCLTGLVPIICEGTVYTNTTTAFITMKTPLTSGNVQNFYIKGGTFVNLNGTQSQKNSSIIKFQSAGALILYPEFRDVDGHGFYQMFDDDAGSYTTSFGEESRMNHGLVDGCVPHYYVALNAKYCFRRRTGSGTGWEYTNCRDDLAVGTSPTGTDIAGTETIGYPAYVRVEGGVGYVVGDITISGHFSGLQVGAVSIDGNNTYRSNVSLTSSSQIDAQAKRAIFFDPQPSVQPVINFTVEPANIGGDIDIADNFPMAVGARFKAQGYGEATGGRYDKANLPTGANAINLCSVKVAQNLGCEVEVWMTGVVNGVAIGLRKQLFAVRHDGTTVTATEITAQGYAQPTPPAANFFTATPTIVSDLVTFTVNYTATSGSNTLQAQYRVRGGGVRVKRLQ